MNVPPVRQEEEAVLATIDSSYWVYQYDSLGQVTSGKKFFSDGTPVPGQQFEYGFDDIGNRTSTKAGGDSSGSSASLRSATYAANTLNQYTSRTVPNALDVLGASHATNSVTINGSAADYRRGEYFQELVGVVNSATSVWQTVSVTNSGGGSTTGSVFVAKTPELFYYDKDGNLTNDGRWLYTWDAENRLVNMTSTNTPPPGSKLKLDFVYDWQGRRIQKLVSTNNGSIYVAQYTNRFVYDGWNLLAILAPNSSVLSSFVWGLDLSGSLQGAGGVGGLLALTDTANGVHFCAYDGNGNLAALVKAADGTVSGNWEYGPFGEVLRQSGLMAKANPFRFSTKYQDDESDNLYYGYRSYNPSTGRWLSRDPLEEQGGVSLYVFVSNDAMDRYDVLGLADKPNWPRASASRQWRHERFFIILTLPCQTDEHRKILDQMYTEMRRFDHYPPNLARLSFATSGNGLPGIKAVFDMEWVPDFGRVAVQMVPNRGERMVRAMTLDGFFGHPLVGVRRWGLHRIGENPVQIEFFTDAWEMPSAWYDDSAMIIFRQAQHDMWVRYLENYGNAWNGRMGVSWKFPYVFVTPPVLLPGSQRNPFRNELPAALQ